MIPILFDKDETAFDSNGLGRLRDCIECRVSEERNSIYECDFSYPVTGANYELIQLGRIIGVTHDDTDDIQPFDIVSFSRPIDGIVTFHCVHISYRQSYLTFASEISVNSLRMVLLTIEDLGTAVIPSTPSANPFTYTRADGWDPEAGYFPLFDGTPHTVRSMLGGTEGSILDTFGGEYEWDKFNVILHEARGTDRDFYIRYGVNMLDYNEEMDSSGTYMSCIPYWTDGVNKIVGSKQTVSGATITNRDECIPLDVSEKFESKPTKAQVEAMGLSVMNAQNPTLPAQNIHVEFVRLQDMGYEGFDELLHCSLCDTINVIFPFYGTKGKFKIVKTVWDVLQDRYESMELGDLSITLSEALGISNSGTSAKISPAEMFEVTEESISVNVSTANSNVSNTKALTKAGYYPIGVVGLSVGTAGAYSRGCYLSDIALGSCTINLRLYATSTSAKNCTVYVLWGKA